MNKEAFLQSIAESVRKKHPWKISQEKYLNLFGELPKEFLAERLAYDNLLEKSKKFKLCELYLSQMKIDINLTLDELIIWELNIDKWEEAKFHNIAPSDIKKILKNK